MLARSLVAWFALIVVESAHGTLRALFLEPAVGEVAARNVGFAVGTGLVLLVAWLFAPWIGARTPRRLLAIGALWTVLTFAFEVALGRLARGYSWDQVFADYDLAAGRLMGIGLLVLLVAPWIGARLRRMA